MTEKSRTFLFDLLRTPSVTGFETPGQRVWADYLRPFADAVHHDDYGTAWATLEGRGGDAAPRLMLEAHVDEIGFMINHVTDKGFLHVVPVGGSDRALARARRLHLFGDHGPVAGVIGSTAIHLRDTKDEKVPAWHELFVDVGATSKDEVAERGLRVGHPAVYADEPDEFAPGRLVGRALDNRIGGFIIARALERLAEDPPEATVLAVNAVQEEIGGNGAKMITYRLRPDVAVVFDVTHATDSPGIDTAKHGGVELGNGPTVNHGSANHPRVVQRLIDVAASEGIPLQHEANSRYTGTDTDSVFISRRGVPSALVSVPLRYMHSPAEHVALDDVERCVELLVAFARSVRTGEAFQNTL